MSNLSRREFMVKSAGAGIAASSLMLSQRLVADDELALVVAKNGSPAQLVRQAIENLGGMSRFVKKGQTVLIKPNIGWDRLPEQAANTNPDEVAEVEIGRAACRERV